jgi:hypothetical protein
VNCTSHPRPKQRFLTRCKGCDGGERQRIFGRLDSSLRRGSGDARRVPGEGDDERTPHPRMHTKPKFPSATIKYPYSGRGRSLRGLDGVLLETSHGMERLSHIGRENRPAEKERQLHSTHRLVRLEACTQRSRPNSEVCMDLDQPNCKHTACGCAARHGRRLLASRESNGSRSVRSKRSTKARQCDAIALARK